MIGSPFVDGEPEPDMINTDGLFDYAKLNRMPMLYLKHTNEYGIKESHNDEYDELYNKWDEIEQRIKKVIRVLGDNGVEYYTFKSIKPYREVTVDIDLLILNSYDKALSVLTDSGYKRLDDGPLSSTFRDPDFRIDYDIYNEIGVSQIIYVDKEKIKGWEYMKPLSTGGAINSLRPEVDLLSVIGHSVIKEQLYILAEYFSTLYFIKDMSDDGVEDFIDMTHKLKLRSAVKAHVGVTAMIHKLVHGSIPAKLKRIIDVFGVDSLETNRMLSSDLSAPHKFHPITVAKTLVEKTGEGSARRSFARQIQSMIRPEFTNSFMSKLISHIQRETY